MEELDDWLDEKIDSLVVGANMYDDLVLKNRGTANRLDFILGLFTVLVGASGAAGALTTPWEELSTLAAIVSVIQMVAAVITVYVQVNRPRQKEILYGNASAGNAAVARAAQAIRVLGKEATTESVAKTVINTLEACFQDDNPLVRKAKAEVKEKTE